MVPAFEPENQFGEGLPLYGPTEISRGLEFLHLSAAEELLWAAAGRKYSEPEEEEHEPGQVTLATRRSAGLTDGASSLPELERTAPRSEPDMAASRSGAARVVRLDDSSYLTVVQPIDSRGVALEAILQKPMTAVLAPYRELRDSLLLIDGVIRQVIEAAKGGIFVPPGDATSLARAIEALADDPVRACQMGEDARAYVVEHFHRDQHGRELAALLSRLAASGRA